ncbi:BolA family protein [Congregibacter litoralis]|uniref:Putative transcriptional regulator, BolA superfamily n=1 Tax=Congregibacter litoralis KT71 TaxID=314285 RepID=A4A5D2_9GAMM|nr:BolA/IbaG family iron-sulfur metabolism protein [Congregibacter litoralis]EAQ99003.1 putative transcriptional regulator, BolA superfamily [Congregibacter litoralis KT71]
MDAKTVEAMVREALVDATVSVEGAGANYDITVVSDAFADMRAVRRQQTVYAAINQAIASGSIHAVNIRALTPAEWESEGA